MYVAWSREVNLHPRSIACCSCTHDPLVVLHAEGVVHMLNPLLLSAISVSHPSCNTVWHSQGLTQNHASTIATLSHTGCSYCWACQNIPSQNHRMTMWILHVHLIKCTENGWEPPVVLCTEYHPHIHTHSLPHTHTCTPTRTPTLCTPTHSAVAGCVVVAVGALENAAQGLLYVCVCLRMKHSNTDTQTSTHTIYMQLQ